MANPIEATVIDGYWAMESSLLFDRMESRPLGLTQDEALARLKRWGDNSLEDKPTISGLHLFWKQLRSPLLLLLVVAAILSALTKDTIEAVIVALIVHRFSRRSCLSTPHLTVGAR